MNKNIYFVLGFIVLIATGILISLPKAESDDTQKLYGGMLNTVTNDNFAYMEGWRDVEDWEIEQCSRKLSTEIDNDLYGRSSTSRKDNKYGTGVTMQALKTEIYGDMFYELAWYINPTQDNVTFSIVVYNPFAGDRLQVINPTEVGQNKGSGYYHAWDDTQNYTRAKLIFDTGEIDVAFVKKGIN